MTWVATAIAVAGVVAGAVNTRNVAKKQDRVAADGIRKQSKNQQETNARLNQTLASIAGSRPDDERQTVQQGYLEQVQRSQATANAGLAKQGISEQYDQLAGQNANKATDYAGAVAQLLSRMDAGVLQRQGEQNRMGDFGMDMNRISRNVQGDAFMTDLAMKGVRRNPYLDAVQGAASAYGQYAGGGGG